MRIPKPMLEHYMLKTRFSSGAAGDDHRLLGVTPRLTNRWRRASIELNLCAFLRPFSGWLAFVTDCQGVLLAPGLWPL